MKIFKLSLTAVSILSIVSCSTRDVSDLPECWGKFEKSKQYIALVDICR